MASRTKGQRVFMPAPTQGVDQRKPIFNLDSSYSPFLLNCFTDNGRLSKRTPFTSIGSVDLNTEGIPLALIPYTTTSPTQIIHVGSGTTRNVTSATTVATPATLSGYSAGLEAYSQADWINFRNLVLLAGRGVVSNYNPATNTYAAGYTFTYAGAGTPNPSICSYRQIVYVASGTTLYYGTIDSAAAAAMTAFTTELPLSVITGNIAAIAPFSFQEGGVLDQYLCVVSMGGDVLLYTGDDPSATDWTIAYRFNLGRDFKSVPTGGIMEGRPVHLQQIPNDLLICPVYSPEIYSLRELMIEGLGGGNFPLYEPIRPIFLNTVVDSAIYGDEIFGWKNVSYLASRNALIISIYSITNNFPFLDPWGDYLSKITTADSNSYSFVIYIDLSTGAIGLHSYYSTSAYFYSLTKACATYSNVFNIISNASLTAQVLKFFDKEATVPNQDFGTTAYTTIAALAPVSALGYRLKNVSQYIMYSNILSTHSFQYSINKNFNVTPGTFIDYATNNTSNEIQATPLGAYGLFPSFITNIKESSTATTNFEFYGMDVILEEGGEY